jgi:hypothetical protein
MHEPDAHVPHEMTPPQPSGHSPHWSPEHAVEASCAVQPTHLLSTQDSLGPHVPQLAVSPPHPFDTWPHCALAGHELGVHDGPVGRFESEVTHEERSKSMNSSAFSCAESFTFEHPAGTFLLNVSAGLTALPTWRSLKTTRPQ